MRKLGLRVAFSARVTLPCYVLTAVLHAQTPTAGGAEALTWPDLSGVYYSIPQGVIPGRNAPVPGQPPPRPTVGSPVGDGRQGRSAEVPSLNQEYMAKWETIRKSRAAGSSEFDNFAKCLPVGMPSMMLTAGYPIEILQARDKIIIFGELNDSMRRIYLDGRKPTQKHLEDPTYAGYSTGHREGDTLVADTVALHPASLIESIETVFTPHSDAMWVRERMRLRNANLLEDRIVVADPKAFTKPWELVQTYRKAEPGKGRDEIREFACSEGLSTAR